MDPRQTHRRFITLAVALGAISLMPVDTSSASCAAPYLTADMEGTTLAVRPGQRLSIEGRAFVIGCDDEGDGALGCSSKGESAMPMTDVRLTLVQGAESWELGAADAGSAEDDQLGHVTWEVEIPVGIVPGRRARLWAENPEGGDPAEVRIDVVGTDQDLLSNEPAV